jgi:heme-degrading monooxygenase HmoA
VQRCLETPGRYLLLVWWETLEAHTVGFRQSAAFGEWRAIIGSHFVSPPVVEHYERVLGWPRPSED